MLCSYAYFNQIANAALFLASGKIIQVFLLWLFAKRNNLDDSSFVNGQNIAVDGGLTASHPVAPGRWA